ncbi:MAG: hypothetical protein QOE79_2219 [Sphingomonadales bacterium]|nr:hypothetical protein [Sphingomonadales bacterium]
MIGVGWAADPDITIGVSSRLALVLGQLITDKAIRRFQYEPQITLSSNRSFLARDEAPIQHGLRVTSWACSLECDTQEEKFVRLVIGQPIRSYLEKCNLAGVVARGRRAAVNATHGNWDRIS